MSKQIIWGGTREALREGRKILPGAIHSDLRFFGADAERAEAVAILKSHPKAKACAAHYAAQGARVFEFDLPEPVVAEPVKPAKK